MDIIGYILLFSGIFSFLACGLSAWLIFRHKTNFTEPEIQSKIVGILWMVPIYAVDSYISLLFPRSSLYVDMLRDCYEAYVLYLFMALMLSLMGCDDDDSYVVAYLEGRRVEDDDEDEEAYGEGDEVHRSDDKVEQRGGSSATQEEGAGAARLSEYDVEYNYDVHNASSSSGREGASVGSSRMKSEGATVRQGAVAESIAQSYGMRSGREFIRHCKLGVLQYCIVRPMVTLIAILLDLTGNYTDGSLAPVSSYLYITVLLNLSVAYAFHTLFQFYHAFEPLLRPHAPLAKFLCIKFVIFFAFWQGVVIAICVSTGTLRGSGSYTTEMISATLQDMLVCFEMFLVSIAHIEAFSYKPFTQEEADGTQANLPLIPPTGGSRRSVGGRVSMAGVIAADELYFTGDVRSGSGGGATAGGAQTVTPENSNKSENSGRFSVFSNTGSSGGFAWGGQGAGMQSRVSATSSGSASTAGRPSMGGSSSVADGDGDGDGDGVGEDLAFGWLDDDMELRGSTGKANTRGGDGIAENQKSGGGSKLLSNAKFGGGWLRKDSKASNASGGSVDRLSESNKSSSKPTNIDNNNNSSSSSSSSSSAKKGGSMMNRNFATSAAIRDFNEAMPVVVLPTNFKPAPRGQVLHSDPSQRIS